MAVEDVLSASKEKLEALLAPIDGGAGADISYDEAFEKVKAEVEKLTSLSGGKVDWHAISSSSEELLTDKGKDFRVALYYAAARANVEGIAGLLDGFVVLAELVEKFWTTMGPSLKRPKARGNLCSWFADLCAPPLASYQPTLKDKDLVKALDQVSRAVDSDLADKLGEAYGGMSALRSNIANLVRALPADPPPPPPPPPPPAPRAEAPPPPVVEAAPEAAAASSGVVAGGLSADAIVDVDSANNALGESIVILTRAAAVLRGADAADAGAYRLLRVGMWLQVHQAPPAENGGTYIAAPPPHYKDHLEGLAGGGDWTALATVVEELVPDWPFWLDPHRYASQALDNLGEPYAAAKRALLREVGLLLSRAPELVDQSFVDGTPFADPATKQWIEGEVKAVMGSGGASSSAPVNKLDAKLDEARNLVANGALPDAVKLLTKAAAGAQTPADRFRGKLAIAQICLQGDQVLVARAALDGLDRLVEQHRLWEWEPDLCSQFYSALYAAHRGTNAAAIGGGGELSVEARARETAVFERLCELDVAAALKFTFGG